MFKKTGQQKLSSSLFLVIVVVAAAVVVAKVNGDLEILILNFCLTGFWLKCLVANIRDMKKRGFQCVAIMKRQPVPRWRILCGLRSTDKPSIFGFPLSGHFCSYVFGYIFIQFVDHHLAFLQFSYCCPASAICGWNDVLAFI